MAVPEPRIVTGTRDHSGTRDETPAPTARVTEWRPMVRGTLRGFATVELVGGIIVADVAIHHGPRGPWASPPGRPMIGADGRAMRDAEGKTRYAPVITFATAAQRYAWSDAVIAALRAAHPEVLTDAA